MAKSINWKSDEHGTSMLRMKRNRRFAFNKEFGAAGFAISGADIEPKQVITDRDSNSAGAGFTVGSAADNLRDISILQLALKKQDAVCHLNMGPSTGFMIADDILMTCNHVLPDKQIARLCRATFNLRLDEKRMPLSIDEYHLDPDKFFETDPVLDITVVKTAGKPGAKAKWGFIQPTKAAPQVGNSAIIIQHPSQLRYKKIALGDMEIKYVDEREIQYLSDTLPGSSGSPIFNDDFSLIGVHRAGDGNPDDNQYFRNEGIHINAIVDFLQTVGLKKLLGASKK